MKIAYKAAVTPSKVRSSVKVNSPDANKKFLSQAMDCLDEMRDDQYKVASEKLANIATKVRERRRTA